MLKRCCILSQCSIVDLILCVDLFYMYMIKQLLSLLDYGAKDRTTDARILRYIDT